MSTVITPFQGIDSFSMATFNNRISQINTGFSYISNPNLLDNWYFGNPVNQRGATGSITINRYFIDRWLYANGDSASSLNFNDGIVTLNGNNGYCALRQIFETPKSEFIGKRITISALTTELGLVSYTFTCLDGVENFKIFSDAGSYLDFDTRADNVLFTFVAELETISVIACKIEFGDQQTLAHQENGVWVLNEIPNYGEQLARCQRYYNVIKAVSVNARYGYGTGASDNICVFVPINVPLRAVPSISMVGNFFAWDGVTPYPATFRAFDSLSTNGVTFSITSTDMTAGKSFQLLDAGTGNSAIILDANL